MSMGIRWVRRLRVLAGRRRAEQVLDAELRHHIDCETADRVRAGMPPDEARRTALRDFGSVEGVKEQVRDARGGRAFVDLSQDLRYAVRVLRRTPGDTASAVLTFALGIGAVTAIVSLAYGILFRPLPYASPERLTVVWETNLPRHRTANVVSLEHFESWRERAHSFAAMGAVVPASLTLAAGETPERLSGAEVTAGFFAMLGVAPALGREFADADTREGNAVILSDALWRRRFGADPSIAGRGIVLSGKPYTVAGVMPSGFDPPRLGWLGEQQFWLPLVASAQARSYGRFLIVLARLAPGLSIEQADVEMRALAAARTVSAPEDEGWSASVVSLTGEITGSVRTPLLLLLGAVVLLLLMAIANVATVTWSGMLRRAQELAVRRAIGATEGRIVRQLLTQSAVLGAIGATTGTLVAIPGVRLLVRMLPPDVPRAAAVEVDAPVLLITIAVAVAGTLIFGSVGALRGRRAAAALWTDVRRGPTATRQGSAALVTIEIALSAALGIMAMLTARSVGHLTSVDLGFAPGGVAIARVALPPTYATADAQRQFFARVVERARALPGVTAAGIISARPLSGIGPATTVRDGVRPADAHGLDPVADVRFIDSGALDALGVALERGTGFDTRDVAGPPRVLIGSTLARTLWPGQDPVGRTLAMEINGHLRATVAGVVRDVRLFDPRTAPRPLAYLSAGRFPDRVRDLAVRVDGDPGALVPSLRVAVAAIDPSLPLYAVTDLTTLIRASSARDRLTMWTLVACGVVALMLAAVGVFGVFAGDVAVRRKEIGIRLALGGSRPRIVGLLLARSTRQVAAGLLAGGVIARLAGRSMESLLFGVTAGDPLSFASVSVVVALLALAATLIPAWQALRRAPLSVLREG